MSDGIGSIIHGHRFRQIIKKAVDNQRPFYFAAEQIGQYWATTITHGKGRYFNCHRSRNKYKQLCIGRIEHDDHAMRETLSTCVAYITKVEQYLVYREFEGDRAFMRSELPPIPEIKLGKPRADMSPKAA